MGNKIIGVMRSIRCVILDMAPTDSKGDPRRMCDMALYSVCHFVLHVLYQFLVCLGKNSHYQ